MDTVNNDLPYKPSCRMAYVINNEQPVICTIVSDQPLFYMDYEEDFEDEMEEDLGLFGLPTDYKSGYDASAADKMDSFVPDIESVISSIEHSDGYQSPEDLKADLLESRMAAAFIEVMEKHDTSFKFSTQIEDATYDRQENKVFIRSDLDKTDQLLLAARELRRIWQHRQGALIDPLQLHPDQSILVNRAQIADLSVMMVRIAWELQLAGQKHIWKRLEASSMGDMARSLARDAFTDFRSLDNGHAMSAAFEAWFLSNRCQHEDRTLIQSMLSGNQTFIQTDEQTSRQISADIIKALGSVPYGKNYLMPYVATITTDSVFTDVRDRSNANFLWFIKFERTFHEAERDLQEKKDINNARTTQRADINSLGDHTDEKGTNIIELPQSAAQPEQTGRKSIGAAKGKDKNVVSFEQFRDTLRLSSEQR